MAVVKVIQIKKSLPGAVKYVCNEAKTEKQRLVSTNYSFLDKNTFQRTLDAFDLLEQQNQRNTLGRSGTVKAHHIIQSFEPGEVSAEDAHAIGLEFMRELTGEDYYYLVATHDDRPHIHNHFLVCPINTTSYKRMRVQRDTLQEWRNLSDKICRRWGLSVIEQGLDQPGYENPHIKARGASKKEALRATIDEAVRVSTDWQGFVDTLGALGVEMSTRRQAVLFRDPQILNQWVRGHRLGAAYTESALMARLGRSPQREFTCGEKLVHMVSNNKAEIHLPGHESKGRVVVDSRNLVQHGNSYHFYLSENERHTVVDRKGNYVTTLSVTDLRRIFNQPNVEINMPILATHSRIRRGKSEAQSRYYAAIDRRVEALQQDIDDNPTLRKLAAMTVDERRAYANEQTRSLLTLRERIDDGYSRLQRMIDLRPDIGTPSADERDLVDHLDTLTKDALDLKHKLGLTRRTLQNEPKPKKGLAL